MEDKLDKFFIKYPRVKDEWSSTKVIIFLSVMHFVIEAMRGDGFEASESIEQFYLITSYFGITLIIFVPLIQLCIIGIGGQKSVDVYHSVINMVKRLLFFSLIMKFIYHCGDDLIALAHTSPITLVKATLSLMLILIPFFLFKRKKTISSKEEEYTPTIFSLKHTCTHESGHALMHGLLVQKFPHLIVSVKPKDNALGYVSSLLDTDAMRTPEGGGVVYASLFGW